MPSNQRIRRLATLATLLAACSAASESRADITFTDLTPTTFSGNWSLDLSPAQTVTGTNTKGLYSLNIAAATNHSWLDSAAIGASPAGIQFIMRHPAGQTDAYSGIAAVNNSTTFDPSNTTGLSSSLVTIDVSMGTRQTSILNDSGQVAVLLVQNGNYYRSAWDVIFRQTNATSSFTGLDAAAFGKIAVGALTSDGTTDFSANPDFSLSGAPFKLGVLMGYEPTLGIANANSRYVISGFSARLRESITSPGTSLNNPITYSYGTNGLGAVSGTGSVTVTGGTVTASSMKLKEVAVASGGSVQILPGNTASSLESLVISSGGKFDITNNALILKGGDLAATSASIAAWLAGGTTGLISSVASPAAFTTIGILSNDAGDGTTPFYSSFGGVSGLGVSDIILRHTYVGDTNLDGTLDGTDLANLLEGLSTGQSGWAWGDLDYSGTVDSTDVATFLAALDAVGGTPLGLPSGTGPAGGVIPEPTTAMLLAPVLLAAGRRRGR